MNSGDGEGTYRAQVKKASVLTEGPSAANPPIASDPPWIRVMPHAPYFKTCPPGCQDQSSPTPCYLGQNFPILSMGYRPGFISGLSQRGPPPVACILCLPSNVVSPY